MVVNMLCWLTGFLGVQWSRRSEWKQKKNIHTHGALTHVCSMPVFEYSLHKYVFRTRGHEFKQIGAHYNHSLSLFWSLTLTRTRLHCSVFFLGVRMCVCVRRGWKWWEGWRFWCVWIYLSNSIHCIYLTCHAYITQAHYAYTSYRLIFTSNSNYQKNTKINNVKYTHTHTRINSSFTLGKLPDSIFIILSLYDCVFWSQSCTYAPSVGHLDTPRLNEKKKGCAHFQPANPNSQQHIHDPLIITKFFVNCLVTPTKNEYNRITLKDREHETELSQKHKKIVTERNVCACAHVRHFSSDNILTHAHTCCSTRSFSFFWLLFVAAVQICIYCLISGWTVQNRPRQYR